MARVQSTIRSTLKNGDFWGRLLVVAFFVMFAYSAYAAQDNEPTGGRCIAETESRAGVVCTDISGP
jgi:hypothetical protein